MKRGLPTTPEEVELLEAMAKFQHTTNYAEVGFWVNSRLYPAGCELARKGWLHWASGPDFLNGRFARFAPGMELSADAVRHRATLEPERDPDLEHRRKDGSLDHGDSEHPQGRH